MRPALIDKQGAYPVYKSLCTEREQANYLAAEIRRQRKRHPLGDMAIVCRFKSQLQGLQTMLAGKGIACSQFTEKDACMPRQSRIDAPGALRHIIARGINCRPVFDDVPVELLFVSKSGCHP